jgi:hypothetical protein
VTGLVATSHARQSWAASDLTLQKLSPEAIRVIEQYARQEAGEKLELYKKMVDDAVFNAMRCNRISEQRAYRVMEQANKLMVEELNKEVKAVS